RELTPDAARREQQRLRWGIDPSTRVVLFFGTPRAHKGLLELARALAGLTDARWQLVIAGSFEDAALRRELESFGPGLIRCLPVQPMSAIADVVSMADVCVLLQQGRGQAPLLQTPAKLTDALAMRVPVLASETAGLQEFIDAGVVVRTTAATVATDLTRWFDTAAGAAERHALTARGRNFFEQKLSYATNVATLKSVVSEAACAARPHRDVLQWQPLQVLREVLRTGR
ncbi:MAG: glycosyltransferase family 4 protein, partial [Sinobacteraceae bacterium]|nr:glycosyltransferase family 4 protein [Nevskiaceae bacterium]